jgi:predicted secreted Zn-dependent protease
MMLATILTLAALAQAQPVAAVAGGVRTIPGVTVRTYDVSGKTIREIYQSLGAVAPKDPASGGAIPASSKWSMKVATQFTRTGARCSVTGATATFTGEVVLPRLAPNPERPAAVLANWNSYVAQLDARQAEQLRFAFERRGEVERAVRASSCDGWQAAANAAIQRLREQASAARDPDPTKQPRLLEVTK